MRSARFLAPSKVEFTGGPLITVSGENRKYLREIPVAGSRLRQPRFRRLMVYAFYSRREPVNESVSEKPE